MAVYKIIITERAIWNCRECPHVSQNGQNYRCLKKDVSLDRDDIYRYNAFPEWCPLATGGSEPIPPERRD